MQSVNQVRQLYVVSEVLSSGTPASLGQVAVKSIFGGKGFLVQHKGQGGLVVSDKVLKDHMILAHTKATPASEMAKTLKQATIALDSSVNSGAPIAGQDYIIDIDVYNYIALGEYQTLNKFAAVRATTGMTASQLYMGLAKSLARNFSREINHFFKFYLKDANGEYEVTVTSADDTTKTYTGVVIKEQSQEADYVLGEQPVVTVNFAVTPKTVIDNGDEVQPFVTAANGTIAIAVQLDGSSNPVTVGNGYDIADLEWFCMGERGDQIRQVGYPRTIRTKYMVDPTKEYDVLDICFYFEDRGMSNQHSDKLMTFVAPVSSVENHEHDLINSLIDKINTILSGSGSTPIAKLS